MSLKGTELNNFNTKNNSTTLATHSKKERQPKIPMISVHL